MRELTSRFAGLRAGDPISPISRIIEWDGGFDDFTRILSSNPPVFARDVQPIRGDSLPIERPARYPFTICRSEMKLLEAIDLFGIPIAPGSLAVDLGAAPGGWSYVLASLGILVTAVDPGALHPLAADNPSVTHIRTTAGQYLQTAPISRASLLVNDMKMDAARSCGVMLDCAPLLTQSGWALMTLKLPSNATPSWPGIIKTARAALEQSYAIVGIRQLRSNRSEAACALTRL